MFQLLLLLATAWPPQCRISFPGVVGWLMSSRKLISFNFVVFELPLSAFRSKHKFEREKINPSIPNAIPLDGCCHGTRSLTKDTWVFGFMYVPLHFFLCIFPFCTIFLKWNRSVSLQRMRCMVYALLWRWWRSKRWKMWSICDAEVRDWAWPQARSGLHKSSLDRTPRFLAVVDQMVMDFFASLIDGLQFQGLTTYLLVGLRIT